MLSLSKHEGDGLVAAACWGHFFAMKQVEAFPRPIELRDPVWIAMPGGCRLAARIWLCVGAEARPVPAILEYIPYRRRDFRAEPDPPPKATGWDAAGVVVAAPPLTRRRAPP
jgi:predicted acyl esterase